MRIALWTTSLVVALGAYALAEDPPRFESDVDLVAVDAFVVDKDGRPVSDLKPGEFTARVDGKPRSVVSVRFVETAPRSADPAAPTAVGAPSAVPRVEGRRVVIVIDREELGVGAAQNAVDAASAFVAEMGPADRAALFSISSGPRMDFTGDKPALLAAIAKVGPARQPFISEFTIDLTEAVVLVQAPARSPLLKRECSQYSRWGRAGQRGEPDPTLLTATGEEQPKEMEQCARRVEMEARRQVEEHQRSVENRLHALEAICEALALVPGPKVLALVSGGLTSVMSAGGPDVINRMRRIADTAAAARITFYAIYLSQRHEVLSAERSREYRTPEGDRQMRAEGLETLTGMNGGHMYEVMASARGAFERLDRETSGYYLLGLAPEKRDRDGKPHDIDVKVLRSGVDVRARKRFVLTGATIARRQPAPPVTPALVAAPRSPVRVATHVLRGGPGGTVKVLVGAEVPGFSGGRLALSVRDVKGDVVGNTSEDLTVVAGRPPSYADTLVLPRGPYVLKAEAVDAGGRREVTDIPLNAELQHGVGFDASDLLLFAEGEAGRELSATGTVRGQVLRPYLEIYVQEGLPTEDLSVSVDIFDADGKRRAAGILAVRDGGEPGLLFAEGRIEIGALPPGRYAARAIIMFANKVSRHVERSFERAPAQSTSR
jgi:VWFA-related protein